jgi:hypothetical protein
VARWLHLGAWGGAAYDTFWQAYAGGIDDRSLERSYGWGVGVSACAALAVLVPVGLVRWSPEGYRLTPRGFDAYHDLERLVTYQLIEPLWAEMLTEHPACDGGGWASPDRARAGWLWSAARRAFERPVATTGDAR